MTDCDIDLYADVEGDFAAESSHDESGDLGDNLKVSKITKYKLSFTNRLFYLFLNLHVFVFSSFKSATFNFYVCKTFFVSEV
jgi:hypothetical protein